jgi:HlyD family type I secretion membrane fusion protein
MKDSQNSKPNIFREKWIGVFIVVVFFGGFGLWAALSPLDSAAIAPGVITVTGHRRVIQHYEGGIVKAIYVKDGSKVKKGQLLIELDETEAQASAQITENKKLEQLAVQTRIIAELKDSDKLEYPDIFKQYIKLPKVKELMDIQLAIVKANNKSFNNEINIYNQQIHQLHKQIEGIKAQYLSNTEQLKFINQELVGVRKLAKEKLIKQSRLLSLEREAASLTGKQGKNNSETATLEQKIGETQLQISALKNKRRKELLAELRETQKILNETLEKYKTLKNVLARTDIRATIAGTVVQLNVHTINRVIKPGETLMEIVPKDAELVIDARINPLDIDVVHEGLNAKVQLSALKPRTTPLLLGKVTHVSADTLKDEKTGQSYYKATVKINPEELRKTQGKELFPGMPVEVMIITNRLTPWEYFIDPINRSFSHAFKED